MIDLSYFGVFLMTWYIGFLLKVEREEVNTKACFVGDHYPSPFMLCLSNARGIFDIWLPNIMGKPLFLYIKESNWTPWIPLLDEPENICQITFLKLGYIPNN